MMTPDQAGEPIAIEEAYDELSQQAFAVWIRLMTANPHELIGRRNIAKLMNYSPSYCDTILRELKHKGYIKFVKAPPGQPSELIIYRRALLSGPSSFINLTNSLFAASCSGAKKARKKTKKNWRNNSSTSIQLAPNSNTGKPAQKPKKNSSSIYHFSASLKDDDEGKKMSRTNTPSGTSGNKRTSRRKKSVGKKSSNQKTGKETTIGIVGEKLPQTRVKAAEESIALGEAPHDRSTSDEGKKVGSTIRKKGVSLSKVRKQYKEIKKERSEKKKKKSKIRTGGHPRQIDWKKLDQRGSPTVSFTPSDEKREVMIEILERSDRHAVKKALVGKLASEFGRIYSRYRRLLQKRKGNRPTYLLPKQERKYAARAAEWCIRKELTPRQVLEYWHENIGNFAEHKMSIPPLVFLSGPANIDTVACAALDSEKTKPKPAVGHGFSDESELDYRLRSGLERAGYETHLFNDRYLLTIQKTAQAIANGARLFVGAEMKPMVDWAARNLYAD